MGNAQNCLEEESKKIKIGGEEERRRRSL